MERGQRRGSRGSQGLKVRHCSTRRSLSKRTGRTAGSRIAVDAGMTCRLRSIRGGSVRGGVAGLVRLGAHGLCRECGPFLFRQTEAGVQLVVQPLGIVDGERHQGGEDVAGHVLEHDADLLHLVFEVVKFARRITCRR